MRQLKDKDSFNQANTLLAEDKDELDSNKYASKSAVYNSYGKNKELIAKYHNTMKTYNTKEAKKEVSDVNNEFDSKINVVPELFMENKYHSLSDALWPDGLTKKDKNHDLTLNWSAVANNLNTIQDKLDKIPTDFKLLLDLQQQILSQTTDLATYTKNLQLLAVVRQSSKTPKLNISALQNSKLVQDIYYKN